MIINYESIFLIFKMHYKAPGKNDMPGFSFKNTIQTIQHFIAMVNIFNFLPSDWKKIKNIWNFYFKNNKYKQ